MNVLIHSHSLPTTRKRDKTPEGEDAMEVFEQQEQKPVVAEVCHQQRDSVYSSAALTVPGC